jgi:hypothetical protein
MREERGGSGLSKGREERPQQRTARPGQGEPAVGGEDWPRGSPGDRGRAGEGLAGPQLRPVPAPAPSPGARPLPRRPPPAAAAAAAAGALAGRSEKAEAAATRAPLRFPVPPPCLTPSPPPAPAKLNVTPA